MLKNKMFKKIIITLCFPIWAFSQTSSQTDLPLEVLSNVDKIVAKIDNYYILKSEVESIVVRAKQENQNLSPCKALESLAVQKLLVAKAEIDSVIVDNDMVNSQLDARMAEMIRLYGNEKNIVQQFNKSIETLKSEFRTEVKERLTAQKMQQTITEKLNITPYEVKKFFSQVPSDSLPIIPTEVILSQIVKLAKVSDEQKNDLIQKLEGIKRKIELGENFADLAKEYSEDQGSKSYGGDLGWSKRGQMVPEFEAAAMSLDSGKLSGIVESDFGFHLIQTIELRGQEFHARHILLRPDYSILDITDSKNFLDSLRNKIIIDSLNFEKQVKIHSDDKMTSTSGGIIIDEESGSNKLQLDANMETYTYFAVDSMKVGQISRPMNYRTPDGKTGMRIVYLKDKIEAHTANLKDDYEKLRNYALNNKQNEIVEKWFREAISEVYISIDPEYKTCKLFE